MWAPLTTVRLSRMRHPAPRLSPGGSGGGEWDFYGLAAATVELQELGDLIFGPAARRYTEAGSGGRFASEVGVRGYKLEEIESDVFGSTG